MNKRYEDNFLDELDKTTDLLKAYKSHMETDEVSSDIIDLSDLDSLYNEIEQEKNTESIKEEELSFNKIEFEHAKIDDIEMTELSDVQEIEQEDKKEKEDINKILSDIKAKNDAVKEEKIENKKEKQVNKVKKTNKKKNVSKVKSKDAKKEKVKFNPFELAFCAFSFLFIIGCVAVYGTRFLKYYKIFNPKSENGQSLTLLTTAIGKNSPVVYEGNGLYMTGGEYVYKGRDVNNYIVYSNMLWRIIKTNTDGTIDIVLDEYINSLPWANRAKNYLESDVHKYLNEYFIKYLDKDYLAFTSICKDEVNNLKEFTCENKNEDSYVRLLSVNEFLNSKTDSTYISTEKDTLWLNSVSNDKTWQVNGLNLSLANPTRALGIKPVVKIKAGVPLIAGDGTKENPYLIKEKDNEIHVGSYVALGNYQFIVYDMDDKTLSLAQTSVLPKKYVFDPNTSVFDVTKESSIAFKMNNYYIDSLSYKNLLVDKEWNIGAYTNSYTDCESKKVKAKLGMLSMEDLKFNNELQDYYLSTSINNKVALYGNETIGSNPAVSQNLRIAISINKPDKIASGEGTKENPFKLGV